MSARIIKINRGDSVSIPLEVCDTKGTYLLTTKDALYFALMAPHQRIDDAVVLKGYTWEEQDQKSGEIILKLTPYDTKYLTPGVYYYCAKLQKGGSLNDLGASEEPDEVLTVIERTKFIINE